MAESIDDLNTHKSIIPPSSTGPYLLLKAWEEDLSTQCAIEARAWSWVSP